MLARGTAVSGSWCPLTRPENYPGVLDGVLGGGGTLRRTHLPAWRLNERWLPWGGPALPEFKGLKVSTVACGQIGSRCEARCGVTSEGVPAECAHLGGKSPEERGVIRV